MSQLEKLTAQIAERTRRRFASRGGPEAAPEGELNTFIAGDVRNAMRVIDDPFAAVIKGWEGQAYQLDLTWWEAEETPAEIVYGLAGAILDFEVRQALGLPV
jgi:hypothetical protein